MNELKPVPRVDSSGQVCGSTFKVDAETKKESAGMPRVDSSYNWSLLSLQVLLWQGFCYMVAFWIVSFSLSSTLISIFHDTTALMCPKSHRY
jgi:hypothetical protein